MTARSKLRALALGLAVLAGVVAAAVALGGVITAQSGPAKPNIIVIETDDQTLEQFRAGVMPNTLKLVAGDGATTFTNMVVTTPLCCPSRAGFLTGQYGHNNGVLSNRPGYAGLEDPGSVLPQWLREAGYTTAHVGKWLHHYEEVVKPKTKVAPGWDEWYTALDPRAYYDYKLMINGEVEKFGGADRDHLTDVLNRTAVRLIRKHVPEQDPLYLQLDEYAPHSGPGSRNHRCVNGAVPAPGDEGLFKHGSPPKPPSYNEQDISDKPSFIAELPAINRKTAKDTKRRYGCALASLAAVDRGVKRIWSVLGKTGERDNTVILFTSDNGYFFGEHRLAKSKFRVYEEAIRVPLAIRAPQSVLGAAPVAEVDEPVANIDLTSTVLDLAGADACVANGGCRIQDGRSLLDLMRGEDGGWPADRAIAIEFKEQGVPSELTSSCVFEGARSAGGIFVEHSSIPDASGESCKPAEEIEYYDLVDDPYQLDNLYPAQGGTPQAQAQSALAAKLDELRDCAGIEGRDPQPPGSSYCD